MNMINLNSFCNALALNIKNKKKRKNLKIYDLKPVFILLSCCTHHQNLK